MKLSILPALLLGLLSSASLYAAASSGVGVKTSSQISAQNDIKNIVIIQPSATQTAGKVVAVSTSGSAYTFLGNPVNIYKPTNSLSVGHKVPGVALVDNNLKSIKVGGSQAKPQVIASVVSLDMPVCSKEALELDKMAIKNPNVNFIVVSQDLPFALEKYAKANKIKNIKFASSFRNDLFGKEFGTLITDSSLKGLNSRAVFVVNKSGNLVYQQRVSEIATPPNYKTLSLAIGSINASDIDE
jgi:thioredoxin-dependent peroxiredoxin